MDFKLIGSILLIAGNAIGAGMLALPIATAQLGFGGALILLCLGWAVMTAGALLLLEVNLWLPQNSNIISMAKATIGPVGQLIAWITYLLLLYSLLCAYIAGGSDLLHNLLDKSGIDMPLGFAAILFTVVFSTIVFFGIRAVDYANRGLMICKFASYSLLIILLVPFVTTENLTNSYLANITSATALTVTMTSFGFAAIIPSLRVYFGGNVRKLQIAIIIGSLIPLICYIFWDAVIMGIVPLAGEHGLLTILHSKTATSDLVNTVSATVVKSSVTLFTKIFTSVCLLTSFLGVALSLSDFLTDGLQLKKNGIQRFVIHALTFFPPLIIVLFFPNTFIKALGYAGVYCITLLVLLPAWMAWRGRYHGRIRKGFTLFGGKPLLIILIVFSLFVIAKGIVVT